MLISHYCILTYVIKIVLKNVYGETTLPPTLGFQSKYIENSEAEVERWWEKVISKLNIRFFSEA